MFFTITDQDGTILHDALSREYRTEDVGFRDAYKKRAVDLGGKFLEIDSPVWPPEGGWILETDADTGEERIREATREEKILSGEISEAEVDAVIEAAINSHCESMIVSGLVSSSLGTPHLYDTGRDDQLNLLGAAMAGVELSFRCSELDANGDGVPGSKTMRLHTAAQIIQVYQEGVAMKLQHLSRASELKNQLASLTLEEKASYDVASRW